MSFIWLMLGVGLGGLIMTFVMRAKHDLDLNSLYQMNISLSKSMNSRSVKLQELETEYEQLNFITTEVERELNAIKTHTQALFKLKDVEFKGVAAKIADSLDELTQVGEDQ